MGRSAILYIGGFELPDRNAAAQRVVSNAKLINSLGYRVILLGTRKPDSQEEIRVGDSRTNFDLYFFPDHYFKKIASLWQIGKVADVLKAETDVKAVICYNYRSVAMWRIKKLCENMGIACIADTTEWYEPHGNLISRIVTAADIFLRMKVVQPKMDGIIPTSKFLYEYYKRFGKPMVILPTLVDGDDMPKPGVSRKELRKLVFFGTASLSKDRLDIIIDILSRVREKEPELPFQLTVIGLTEEDYRSAFNKSVIPEQLANHIFFLGRMRREETLNIVSESDFSMLIRPDNRVCKAGFPTKFSESIACGTPVIANLSSDLGRYIKEGENGWLIDVNDIEDASEKVISLLKIPFDKLTEIKKACAMGRSLDFRSFAGPTKAFLEEVVKT